ncbi:MAG: tetratricopeptide repeat protein [Patescibacteria group bacterium]
MDTYTSPVVNETITPPQTPPTPPEEKKSLLEKISLVVFMITIFILPFAFVPNPYAPVEITKTVVVAFGTLIPLLCLAFLSIKKKTLKIPYHPLLITMGAILLATVLSGFGSASIWKSFIGQGFEVGTVSFLALLFVVATLTVHFTLKNRDRILQIYTALLASFSVVALFHLTRLIFGADFLSFGVLGSLTSSLVGTWYDFGIFASIILLISFFGIKFFTTGKVLKALLFFFLAVSVITVFIVNSALVWLALAIVFLGVSVYEFLSSSAPTFAKKFPVFSLVLLIISLLCVWQGPRIADILASSLQINPTEIALSWRSTLDVATATLKNSPVLGAGPNRFGSEYLLYKPLAVNSTIFWNTEFSNGSGFIPTTLVTGGVLGFALWILFLVFFLKSGISALRHSVDPKTRFVVTSTFFTASFLWVMSILYAPSHAILFFTFLFTGLFITSLFVDNKISFMQVGGGEGGLMKLTVRVALIAFLAFCIIWTIVYAKKAIALSYFRSGIHALNLADSAGLEKAENKFKKSLMYDSSDVYYQALSEITILKITALAQQLQAQADAGAKTLDQETLEKISTLVTSALESTNSAIKLDPTNYYNYISQARISEVATSLKIPNAYENAKASYANALIHNPLNPGLYLSLARLEASQNKMDEAFQNIGNALQLKQNYTEAIFFLSQLQVSQGKIADAITSVLATTQLNPTNPLLFFQLGLLYYNDKQYQEAGVSFSKAVELSPVYANARYFLGLTLARLGRNPEAIAQFEAVLETNPENQEVALIISNLKAGKSPFTDAKPPVDNTPEKRDTLPVKETTSSAPKTKKTP